MKRSIIIHHQFEPELITSFFRQWCADQSTPIFTHKIDYLRRYLVGSHNKIAFIFPILIIYYNYQFSLLYIFNRTFYRIEHIKYFYAKLIE